MRERNTLDPSLPKDKWWTTWLMLMASVWKLCPSAVGKKRMVPGMRLTWNEAQSFTSNVLIENRKPAANKRPTKRVTTRLAGQYLKTAWCQTLANTSAACCRTLQETDYFLSFPKIVQQTKADLGFFTQPLFTKFTFSFVIVFQMCFDRMYRPRMVPRAPTMHGHFIRRMVASGEHEWRTASDGRGGFQTHSRVG